LRQSGTRSHLDPTLTSGLSRLNKPCALGAVRSKETFWGNTDQERRMGIKHLRNTPLAESVVPCVKVATEPGGESARLLKRIPQLVP
jgi:hypothetical protein